MGPYRMSQAPAAARLVAPTGGTLGVISGLLRTAAGTIDLTAVAAAANKHLRSTTDTHEQPGRHLHRRGLAHAWTTITMLGIMPRHACSARCGARRRSGTWRFRSAPCLPIGGLSPRQSASDARRHAARHAHACGYVDNARALPTYPQAQQSTTSINLILQKAWAQTQPVIFRRPSVQAVMARQRYHASFLSELGQPFTRIIRSARFAAGSVEMIRRMCLSTASERSPWARAVQSSMQRSSCLE
jgi:hypothetical protein